MTDYFKDFYKFWFYENQDGFPKGYPKDLNLKYKDNKTIVNIFHELGITREKTQIFKIIRGINSYVTYVNGSLLVDEILNYAYINKYSLNKRELCFNSIFDCLTVQIMHNISFYHSMEMSGICGTVKLAKHVGKGLLNWLDSSSKSGSSLIVNIFTEPSRSTRDLIAKRSPIIANYIVNSLITNLFVLLSVFDENDYRKLLRHFIIYDYNKCFNITPYSNTNPFYQCTLREILDTNNLDKFTNYLQANYVNKIEKLLPKSFSGTIETFKKDCDVYIPDSKGNFGF